MGNARQVSSTKVVTLAADKKGMSMRQNEQNMAGACVICLTTSGGLPLFTRKTADFKSVSQMLGTDDMIFRFVMNRSLRVFSRAFRVVHVFPLPEGVTKALLTSDPPGAIPFCDDLFVGVLFKRTLWAVGSLALMSAIFVYRSPISRTL